MSISLYEASVPSFLQGLEALKNLLAKGATSGKPCDQLTEARLIADMHPLRYQVQSVAFHSLGALRAMRAGELTPPGERPQHDYAQLQALVEETAEALRGWTAGEVDASSGKDVVFRMRGAERWFTAEGFLLSFALPNFYFHLVTAYDILRAQGVEIGKLDYIGPLRLKAPVGSP